MYRSHLDKEQDMNMWGEAFDAMNELDGEAEKMTVDQRLKLAEIKALLSISQELSRIHHGGINPGYDSGS